MSPLSCAFSYYLRQNSIMWNALLKNKSRVTSLEHKTIKSEKITGDFPPFINGRLTAYDASVTVVGGLIEQRNIRVRLTDTSLFSTLYHRDA